MTLLLAFSRLLLFLLIFFCFFVVVEVIDSHESINVTQNPLPPYPVTHAKMTHPTPAAQSVRCTVL